MRDPLEDREFDVRRTLVGVAIVVAGAVVLGVVNPTALGTIGVLLGVVLMIMVHEAGHYVTARWSDMKITEFFVGFGPRLWSTRRGETEYGVKAIPAGGYVRIVGMHNLEEVDPEDEPRTYRSKPYRNRLMVAVAGSVTHFVMAIGLLVLVYGGLGVPETRPVVREVVEGTPAAAAGLEVGDRIEAVDGRPVEEWVDVLDEVQPRPEERIVFTVERDGRTVTLPVVTTVREDDGERVGFVGVAPVVEEVTRPLPTAAADAVVDTGKIAKESVVAVGRFFTPSSLDRYFDALTGEQEPAQDSRFLSPVGATQVANQAVQEGLWEVLFFLALINVFVGTLNMFPLPPLDGGHVAVATYEKIASTVRRRRVQVDMAKVMPIAFLVIVVFLFIGLSALWLDIVRPIDLSN